MRASVPHPAPESNWSFTGRFARESSRPTTFNLWPGSATSGVTVSVPPDGRAADAGSVLPAASGTVAEAVPVNVRQRAATSSRAEQTRAMAIDLFIIEGKDDSQYWRRELRPEVKK